MSPAPGNCTATQHCRRQGEKQASAAWFCTKVPPSCFSNLLRKSLLRACSILGIACNHLAGMGYFHLIFSFSKNFIPSWDPSQKRGNCLTQTHYRCYNSNNWEKRKRGISSSSIHLSQSFQSWQRVCIYICGIFLNEQQTPAAAGLCNAPHPQMYLSRESEH